MLTQEHINEIFQRMHAIENEFECSENLDHYQRLSLLQEHEALNLIYFLYA